MPRNSHDRTGSAAGREMLAVVAHELKSPIAAGRAAAVALRDPALDEVARARLVGVVADAADQLARLADDLARAAESGEAALAVDLIPCDVGLAVAEALAGARTASPEVTFTLDVAEDAPPALADSGRVRQIVTNLLDNARRYGRGPVSVRVRAVGDAVTVTVADRGAGIPEHERERAFEPGVRLEEAAGPGSGLGLALSRELAQAMGGQLAYEPAVDGGAALVLTLRPAP